MMTRTRTSISLISIRNHDADDNDDVDDDNDDDGDDDNDDDEDKNQEKQFYVEKETFLA